MNTWEPTNGVNTGNQTWVCMGIRYGCEYNLYIQVESAVDVNTQESEKGRDYRRTRHEYRSTGHRCEYKE